MSDNSNFDSDLWDCLVPEIEQFFAAIKNKNPAIACFLQYPQKAYYSTFSGAGAAFLNAEGSTREARGDGVSLSISYFFDEHMNVDCYFGWNETGAVVAEKVIVVKTDDDLMLKNVSEQVRIFLKESVDALVEAMS